MSQILLYVYYLFKHDIDSSQFSLGTKLQRCNSAPSKTECNRLIIPRIGDRISRLLIKRSRGSSEIRRCGRCRLDEFSEDVDPPWPIQPRDILTDPRDRRRRGANCSCDQVSFSRAQRADVDGIAQTRVCIRDSQICHEMKCQ